MNAPARPATAADTAGVHPPAGPSRMRKRHKGIIWSFVLFALLPALLCACYLWMIAEDQYASTVGFSVRKEQTSPAVEIFGGLTQISSSNSSDSDILYEFLQSQELVSQLQDEVDLATIWSRPEFDPVFAYRPDGTIEDLLDHWERMVQVTYDTTSGLLEIRVLAFRPEDATQIATALFDKSNILINELSDIAREDTLRSTRQDLDEAIEYLKETRETVTRFRNRNQLVDPEADLQTQATLLGSLQQGLAETLIEVELLRGETRANDPRLVQGLRRIEVIREQIEVERSKLGLGTNDSGDDAFAVIVGEYERLIVDREIAEQAYAAAFAEYERSLAEARRQSRYLAAHIKPTLAEKAEFPQRWIFFGIICVFLLTIWSIAVMVFFSVKDRR